MDWLIEFGDVVLAAYDADNPSGPEMQRLREFLEVGHDE
jgi:hypothetical protein